MKLRVLDRHKGIIGSRKVVRSARARLNRLSIIPHCQIEGSMRPDWLYFSIRPGAHSGVFINKSLSTGADSTVTILTNDEFFACCDSNYDIYNVGVSHDLLSEDVLSDVDNELLTRSSLYQIPGWLKHRVCQQIHALSSTQADEQTFESTLGDVANTLLTVLSPSCRMPTTNRHRIIQTSIELIRSNIYHRFSPEELAEASHCSIRTLQYAFRKSLGLSPKQFLDRYRLNRFREELLTRRGQSVISVATQYDFQHLGNLSRVYRQLFGETPSASQAG
ncbi:MAG: helix-turn-helix domain-containing protein [Pseudomonadales bacterium]|nr:helix-turn-helix domain-containing protein [Pseudomonadales bacterium]